MNGNRNIIIFDGVCNFCNSAVNFIINRDPNGVYAFTPMQSEISQELIEKYQEGDFDFDTFLLIKNGVCYVRTDAILEIIQDLTGYWFLFGVSRVIPRSIRDYCYSVVARNRYKLFGKRESCMVPTPEVRNRFI